MKNHASKLKEFCIKKIQYKKHHVIFLTFNWLVDSGSGPTVLFGNSVLLNHNVPAFTYMLGLVFDLSMLITFLIPF